MKHVLKRVDPIHIIITSWNQSQHHVHLEYRYPSLMKIQQHLGRGLITRSKIDDWELFAVTCLCRIVNTFWLVLFMHTGLVPYSYKVPVWIVSSELVCTLMAAYLPMRQDAVFHIECSPHVSGGYHIGRRSYRFFRREFHPQALIPSPQKTKHQESLQTHADRSRILKT